MKSKPTTIRFSDGTLEEIRRKFPDVPAAIIIRRAVSYYLESIPEPESIKASPK